MTKNDPKIFYITENAESTVAKQSKTTMQRVWFCVSKIVPESSKPDERG